MDKSRTTPVLTIAFAPTVFSGNPNEAARAATPLVAYLERRLGQPVCFVSGESYVETIAGLRSGGIDAAMLGEEATRTAESHGGIEPLVAMVIADQPNSREHATYTSSIFTRIDTGIHDVAALAGRSIGYVDEHSTSGYIVPRAMLREAGLDPHQDLTMCRYGRHRSVVEAVLDGEIDAGGVHTRWLSPPSLERGHEYARLRVLAVSRPIPKGPMVVRSGLDPASREALADALLHVHEEDTSAAQVLLSFGHRFTRPSGRSVPTLKSIASLAGVSYATVSRVVNNSGYVAPDTAARVRSIVDELGYRPNGNALTLQGHRVPLVGVVIDPQMDVRGQPVIESLRTSLEQAGVPLVLCPIAGSIGESVYVDLVRDGRLGVLVVLEHCRADPMLADLARTGRVIITIGDSGDIPGVVRCSPETASQAILNALGREPIAKPSDRRRDRQSLVASG